MPEEDLRSHLFEGKTAYKEFLERELARLEAEGKDLKSRVTDARKRYQESKSKVEMKKKSILVSLPSINKSTFFLEIDIIFFLL